MQNDVIIINTDGGSRGNPGPGACAFSIRNGFKVIFQGSRYLGTTTNNDAEYRGVILALETIEHNLEVFEKSSIQFLLDSELVVKQLNGLYKIKNENLRNLYSEIFSKIKKIGIKISFCHVPREKNKKADQLVNEELDKNI